MPPQNLLPAQWMHASREVREYLAAMWKLTRSGITEIRDQDVISDGYTLDDLRGITLEKMTEYIGSEETFARAWEITQSKAYSELHPPVGIIQPTEEERIAADEIKGITERVEVIEEAGPVPTSVFDIPDEKKDK